MTTPTPSQPANPSSASKKTAAHISTPSHLNYSSPAPRSIPSPVATRKDQFGFNVARKEEAVRTPVNHPTNGSSGSKTLGGTPMFASLSAQGNPASNSPGTSLLAAFSTPIGLGVGFDAAYPVGGFGSISNLDVPVQSSRSMQWNDLDERRAKMRKISEILSRSKAKGGEEGIARASRRVGFQIDIDAERLSAEERERKVGNRSISIAGNKLVIDIELKAHVVQGVQVLFDSENKKLTDVQAPAAAGVLMDDLKAPNDIPLLANLDRFQHNLERIAIIDRQSSGQVNCFEALSGIYTSLSRLYEQERRFADEAEVTCKKSGRPRLHANGRLGLVVEYWRHSRFRPDLDEHASDNAVHRLQIEVESDDAGYSPPLHVTESWLPDDFELSTEGTEPFVIPWQDPPPETIANTNIKEEIGSDGLVKNKNLKFVAKLDPPVLMEYTTAMTLFDTFQMPRPHTAYLPGLYHATLVDPKVQPTTVAEPPQTYTRVKDVVRPVGGTDKIVHHVNTLFAVESQEYGWPVNSLEFSHPRQLIEALPLLRQWAQLGHLIRTAFPKDDIHANGESRPENSINADNLLETPIAAASAHAETAPLSLDVAVQCLPRPNLTVTFLHPQFEAPVTLAIHMLGNADMVIDRGRTGDDGDVVAEDEDRKAATALDRCADLDVWVEWLRTQK